MFIVYFSKKKKINIIIFIIRNTQGLGFARNPCDNCIKEETVDYLDCAAVNITLKYDKQYFYIPKQFVTIKSTETFKVFSNLLHKPALQTYKINFRH